MRTIASRTRCSAMPVTMTSVQATRMCVAAIMIPSSSIAIARFLQSWHGYCEFESYISGILGRYQGSGVWPLIICAFRDHRRFDIHHLLYTSINTVALTEYVYHEYPRMIHGELFGCHKLEKPKTSCKNLGHLIERQT